MPFRLRALLAANNIHNTEDCSSDEFFVWRYFDLKTTIVPKVANELISRALQRLARIVRLSTSTIPTRPQPLETGI